jgi:hypothetical protein
LQWIPPSANFKVVAIKFGEKMKQDKIKRLEIANNFAGSPTPIQRIIRAELHFVRVD